MWSAGLPNRDADQGLHRGGARAGVAGRGAGGGPVRRGARGLVVTRGAARRLVPVLPRPPVSPLRGGHRTVPMRLKRDTDTVPPGVTASEVQCSLRSFKSSVVAVCDHCSVCLEGMSENAK